MLLWTLRCKHLFVLFFNFNSLLANGELSYFLPTRWCYSWIYLFAKSSRDQKVSLSTTQNLNKWGKKNAHGQKIKLVSLFRENFSLYIIFKIHFWFSFRSCGKHLFKSLWKDSLFCNVWSSRFLWASNAEGYSMVFSFPLSRCCLAKTLCFQLSNILSRISRGARILAWFVSTMQPFNTISSKMMCTLSKLNIISSSLTRLK